MEELSPLFMNLFIQAIQTMTVSALLGLFPVWTGSELGCLVPDDFLSFYLANTFI